MNPDIERISKLKPYSKRYIKQHEEEIRQDVVRIAKKYLGAKYHVNGMLPYRASDPTSVFTLAKKHICKEFKSSELKHGKNDRAT